MYSTELRAGNLLVKSSSVDADHDPRIGEQDIGLLEILDVFISEKDQYSVSIQTNVFSRTWSSPF